MGRLRLSTKEIDRVALLREHLLPGERDLMIALFEKGEGVASLARAAEVSARRLERRANRIIERLLDPMFAFVAVQSPLWPEMRRRIARLIVLEGRSQRAAADVARCSVHRVRQELFTIRHLLQQALATGSHHR